MRYVITIIVLICFCACQEVKFATYDADNYVQFTRSLEDSTVVSFTFYPGEDELLWALPVEISGIPVESELQYNVVVDKERSTAIEGTHFELLPEMNIKPLAIGDTCWLKLMRTPEMETEEFRIVLRIIDSEALLRGPLAYSIAIVRVNDKITRPDWWDDNIVWYYLGEYSDKKYSLFIDVTGKADLTGLSDSEIREYALQFKYWLKAQKEEGNIIREDDENNTEMTVEVLG